MNEFPDRSPEALQEEIAVLRHQLVSVLMLVLGVAAIVTWYFAYQFYFNSTDSHRIAESTKEKQAQIEGFASSEPQFQEMLRKFRDYSKTHADVAEVLKKYGVLQPPTVPVAAPKK